VILDRLRSRPRSTPIDVPPRIPKKPQTRPRHLALPRCRLPRRTVCSPRRIWEAPHAESTPKRLVLVSGSTTLTLDKDAGRVSLQRKFAFWKLKPVDAALEDIVSVTVDKSVDRTSGVEMYSTMLVTRAGAGWVLSANDKDQAEKNAAAIRGFVELQP
jgi:hypothetical protein